MIDPNDRGALYKRLCEFAETFWEFHAASMNIEVDRDHGHEVQVEDIARQLDASQQLSTAMDQMQMDLASIGEEIEGVGL